MTTEHYFTAADAVADAPPALRLLTFCVVVLPNGYVSAGESVCTNPADFNAEVGRAIARGHALRRAAAVAHLPAKDYGRTTTDETLPPSTRQYHGAVP